MPTQFYLVPRRQLSFAHAYSVVTAPKMAPKAAGNGFAPALAPASLQGSL